MLVSFFFASLSHKRWKKLFLQFSSCLHCFLRCSIHLLVEIHNKCILARIWTIIIFELFIFCDVFVKLDPRTETRRPKKYCYQITWSKQEDQKKNFQQAKNDNWVEIVVLIFLLLTQSCWSNLVLLYLSSYKFLFM